MTVEGNRLVDGSGRAVRLLGVNRSGAEYACVQGYGFFDGPTDRASIVAMKSWRINAVRVPLNPQCWLGSATVKPALRGPRYRAAISGYVSRLERAGLWVILDMHLAGAGDNRANRILRMPDADHAPAFWRSVASHFRSDHHLLFDLYNEPHDVGWRCWLHGCRIPGYADPQGHVDSYRAAGMQDLVDAVRSAGATQPLMLGGLDWARSLRGWLAHRPRDPLHHLAASEHNYGGLAPCGRRCRSAIAASARRVPVVVGELGETDCRHGYIDRFMPWADSHGISYLGWTWNATAPGSWTCRGGPALIDTFGGVPTAFGRGFRDHLRDLAAR
ncbi:MAG: cellulase family glycosylhydrolase [Solirubrobacterales bacterium]